MGFLPWCSDIDCLAMHCSRHKMACMALSPQNIGSIVRTHAYGKWGVRFALPRAIRLEPPGLGWNDRLQGVCGVSSR